MGIVSKENGVLKLVRAGGIVELYKYPITASQVMEKYPRHCVTRPDVFKFPYIVIKPESILKPGRVFFIVPHHTIRRLLQSKGYRIRRNYPPDYNEGVNKQPPDPDHNPNFNRRLTRQPSDKTLRQMEEIDTSFFHQIIPVENFQIKKQSNNREIKVIIPRRQVANISLEEKEANCGSKLEEEYDSDEAFSSTSGCFPSRKKSGGGVEASNDGSGTTRATCTGLKSCLKRNQKNNKARFQQGPRVRFTLPDDDGDYENWDTDFSEF